MCLRQLCSALKTPKSKCHSVSEWICPGQLKSVKGEKGDDDDDDDEDDDDERGGELGRREH